METNSSQKVSCVVNYTYDASEADELTIRPGDVLKDIERLPGGWWRGELRGRRGMFPDNFVTVLQEHATNRANTVQGRCRAVFSYLPANPDELPLCVGDVLEVLGEVEEGWWQGRRAGRVGVFPSNFVVMLDPHNAAQQPAPVEPAPALPPKPVKEQCRVLFPYTAVNEDELTLADGDIVTIVSKDAPDRGWWRGEVNGRVGLFPDNFVQLLPAVAQDVEEKKPDRPPSKGSNSIYPVLNKYSEKTSSIKELATTKLSMHKENTISKESSTQSTVTHTSKSDSEKITHSESVTDGPDGQVKKPPVPVKKSPTPTSAVTGLFSGLKNKMMSSSDKSEKTSTSISNSSNSSVEGDKPDGALSSKVANTNTFDHVERNSILNDPRASRVKAPRRRPPSQVMRDDSPVSLGLTNGHEASPDKTLDKSSDRSSDKSLDKSSEIKPRAREWEKHRAPWMAELKLNQAKKGGLGDRKQHTSTDRIVDCGIEEKRSSHSMEMSKSTSSISSRISVLESSESSFDKIRTSDKKESPPPDLPTTKPPPLTSPTAAGRTLTTMLDEIKKPPAPSPPLASARLDLDKSLDKSDKSIDKSLDGSLDRSDKSLDKSDKVELREKSELKTERLETISRFSSVFNEVEEKGISFSSSILSSSGISPSAERTSTLERRHTRTQEHEGNDALIAQLNNRISNLEKLIEVQNAKFTAAIEELTNKLSLETEKRQTLQTEMEKLAQCVTQV